MDLLVTKKSLTEFDPDSGRPVSSYSDAIVDHDASKAEYLVGKLRASLADPSFRGVMPIIGGTLSQQIWSNQLSAILDIAFAIRPDRPELKRQIRDIASKAKEENWDGDNAAAVPPSAVQHALQLADLLPADIVDPEVTPTPHGEIDFDWMNADREMLTLGVDANGEVAWAAELNSASGRGILKEMNELLSLLKGYLQPFCCR